MNTSQIYNIYEYITKENDFTRIAIGAIVAFVLYFVLRKVIHSFFKRTDFLSERKERTIESMLHSILRYATTFGFIVYALGVFNIKVGSILAGAGVIGIIVGFGAQSLIKDLLAGIFLLYEKQLHQGDWVKVNNLHQGTVEETGLRFLKIRQWSGVLLTISNGEVRSIENYNIEKMRVIEHVTISFYENPKRIFTILESTCTQLNEELDDFLKRDISGKPIESFSLYGMSSLNDQYRGYQYTITGLCNDDVYFTAAKETRRILAETLFEHKIQMAEQHIDMRKQPTD